MPPRGLRDGRLLRRIFGLEGWGVRGGDALVLAGGMRCSCMAVRVRGLMV